MYGARHFFFTPTSLLVALAALAVLGAGCGKDAVEKDEVVDLEPGYAVASPDGTAWRVRLRGRVYEPAREGKVRSAGLEALRKSLGLAREAAESAVFRERAGAFLADHEGDRKVVLEIAGKRFPFEETEGNGIFERAVEIPSAAAAGGKPAGGARYVPVAFPGIPAARTSGARVLLVPPGGVTVVSDIDDTVKISEVRDRNRLLERTFLLPFEAVPGMAAAYGRWEAQGAVFHYLSAGPWQLQRPIAGFLDDAGFPVGSLQMREVRWRDAPSLALSGTPRKHKDDSLAALIADFPGRRFVLVGDSGEEDPEIYGTAARAHPERVAAIFIREVAPGPEAEARYAKAFEGIPRNRWRIFTDPAALGDLPR